MGRRSKLSPVDVAYFTQAVDIDIVAACRVIAAAGGPGDAGINDAMRALEDLIPRRVHMRSLVTPDSTKSGRAKRTAGAPTPRARRPRAASTEVPPVAPPPPPERAALAEDENGAGQTEEQRTWQLRIESAVRNSKLDPTRVDAAIADATGGSYPTRQALRAAPVEVLTTIHRALLSYMNAES